MIKPICFFAALLLSLSSYAKTPSTVNTLGDTFTWPGGSKLAVSLSYDDALNSQLDNVIPALDKQNFKASFYVVVNSPVMNVRLDEWRAAANRGHELGNHSVYHPCRASLPNKDWVAAHHDLDHYSVAQMIEELKVANTFLKAIDGQSERTYTVPCGDMVIGADVLSHQQYLSQLNELFTAVKGQGKDSRFSLILYPEGQSGKELIDYIRHIPADTLLVNVIFHGVGGDYLSVSSEAHAELLTFLANNRDAYYVDSYINLMKYADSKL
jgi:hypothetical protein